MNEAIKSTDPRNQKISDEDLAAVIRGERQFDRVGATQIAEELLRYRRAARGDSRRAEQFRRLRWQAENLTEKCEEFLRRIQRLSGEVEGETLDEIVAREAATCG